MLPLSRAGLAERALQAVLDARDVEIAIADAYGYQPRALDESQLPEKLAALKPAQLRQVIQANERAIVQGRAHLGYIKHVQDQINEIGKVLG